MESILSEIYTILSRLWDFLSYPFHMIDIAVQFGQSAWHYTTDILSIFPPWITGSVALVFALGVCLFVLHR